VGFGIKFMLGSVMFCFHLQQPESNWSVQDALESEGASRKMLNTSFCFLQELYFRHGIFGLIVPFKLRILMCAVCTLSCFSAKSTGHQQLADVSVLSDCVAQSLLGFPVCALFSGGRHRGGGRGELYLAVEGKGCQRGFLRVPDPRSRLAYGMSS
jgi:hypothetical protein